MAGATIIVTQQELSKEEKSRVGSSKKSNVSLFTKTPHLNQIQCPSTLSIYFLWHIF